MYCHTGRPEAEGDGEFERVCALDEECFGANEGEEGQHTPLDELRPMHHPQRGRFIDVCCAGVALDDAQCVI